MTKVLNSSVWRKSFLCCKVDGKINLDNCKKVAAHGERIIRYRPILKTKRVLKFTYFLLTNVIYDI